MTEKQTIEVLKMNRPFAYSELQKAIDVAIQALEEIQQYRAIGTIEEFKAFKLGRLGNKGFITIGQTVEEFKQEIRAKAIDEFENEIVAEYDNDACPNVTDYLDYEISIRDLFRIAEQMKGEKA